MKEEFPKIYKPKETEEKIYQEWLKKNLFKAEVNPQKKPYCIMIPPPNITGSLHMGHALNLTIQDVLIRAKRMQGYEAMWLPGTDHAGIATQMVVEKELAKKGLTREGLGRENFLKEVWDWADKYKRKILSQLEKLGASCDWSRERFTLDEVCSKAVKKAFFYFFEKGYIYKGHYIVNWCCRCHTAISDLEVEHKKTQGFLYYINYPMEEGGQITIATTRPETILADTAVAVNPNDPRYKKHIGKYAILPLLVRKLPVIADEAVDIEFGTGALKITPAHDLNDYEIGKRHKLDIIVAIDDKGKMNKNALGFAGQDRFECRENIVKELKEKGFLAKIEDYELALATCERCKDAIEPHLSRQWFMKMKDLAEPAIKAVKAGRVKFIPEKFTKIYLNWMGGIKDWCISRQLWWGHRIPVWECMDCKDSFASMDEPKECKICKSKNIKQDSDVLDTWFSSGLWPFSTLGWPEQTEDLNYFYPTSLLSTAREIIFLWVARMIMMGLEFKGDIPFQDVYIHATILNAEGRRMSKSLGTGIDPLELIDKYGADATRFGLLLETEQGQDIWFSEDRIKLSRNFANKIWNATRFVMQNSPGTVSERPLSGYALEKPDKWILSSINKTIKGAGKFLNEYDFARLSRSLYDFFWDDFCDWYIEATKPVLSGNDPEKKEKTIFILHYVLERFLKLAHPLMPFITEEIYRNLYPGYKENIMVSSWPLADENLINEGASCEFGFIRDIIRGIRNLRAEVAIKPQDNINISVQSAQQNLLDMIEENKELIKNLAKVYEISYLEASLEKPKKALSLRVNQLDIFLPLDEKIDISCEIERLKKELRAKEGDIARVSKKLQNIDFIKKAPPEIIEKEKIKLKDLNEAKEKVKSRLDLLSRAEAGTNRNI